MKKPDEITGTFQRLEWMAVQAWKDLKSVYYANTLVWRWLKSGALVFLGFCVWAGAAVVLSVRPEWSILHLVMAYGFLLVFWGPLTHFLIVPLVIRLRRTATNPHVRRIVRHGGKINLTIFFTIVVILAVIQPGFMLLEFSPLQDDPSPEVEGTLSCEASTGDLYSCEITDGSGFDHAVMIADGDVIDRADDPPYRLEVRQSEVEATTVRIQLRSQDESPLRTYVESLPTG